MKAFKDLEFSEMQNGLKGRHAKIFFSNGRGASVISGPLFNGGMEDLYEMAVFRGSEKDHVMDYKTSVTSDVMTYLDEKAVSSVLEKIQNLKDTKEVKKLKIFKELGNENGNQRTN